MEEDDDDYLPEVTSVAVVPSNSSSSSSSSSSSAARRKDSAGSDTEEDSYEDKHIESIVHRRGSKNVPGASSGGFTGPKRDPWTSAKEKEPDEVASSSYFSTSANASSTSIASTRSTAVGGGWSRAKPKTAPAGPPPAAMAKLNRGPLQGSAASSSTSATSSSSATAHPDSEHSSTDKRGLGKFGTVSRDADTESDDEDSPTARVSPEKASERKPYSLADESDLDDSGDSREQLELKDVLRQTNTRSTTDAGEGDGNDDLDDVGDDVIRRPIERKDMSPFEEYVQGKRASGITLTRRSGIYDDDDENDEEAAGAEEGEGDGEEGRAAGGGGKGSTGGRGRSRRAGKGTTRDPGYGGLQVGGLPFVLVAHERGFRTDHVQCTIYRDRSTLQTKLYPEYELVLDETKKPLLLARKMSLNRTSNYHIFDLTRGVAGSRLTKKSGNYLGKVRALTSARTEYLLLGANTHTREELAGIAFERLTLLSQLKTGSQPRKLCALVPALDDCQIPIPNCPAPPPAGDRGAEAKAAGPRGGKGEESIATLLKTPHTANSHGMHVLETKAPTYDNGNYRLNFKGRVNLPSVKNFQLVSPADVTDVVCQFGKVTEDKFHLDFKAPLNAFQAFALAITQFNL